jgi:hypothetical protein
VSIVFDAMPINETPAGWLPRAARAAYAACLPTAPSGSVRLASDFVLFALAPLDMIRRSSYQADPPSGGRLGIEPDAFDNNVI